MLRGTTRLFLSFYQNLVIILRSRIGTKCASQVLISFIMQHLPPRVCQSLCMLYSFSTALIEDPVGGTEGELCVAGCAGAPPGRSRIPVPFSPELFSTLPLIRFPFLSACGP